MDCGKSPSQVAALPAGGSASHTYLHDAAGRLTGVGYPGGVGVGYGYLNGVLRVVTSTVGGAPVPIANEIAHEPFGGIRSWTYGNGLTRVQQRDLNGRLTEIATRNGSSPLQRLTYAYDVADRITGITNAVHGTLSQSCGYDALSRLTSVTASGANQSFAWDANGNRSSHVWAGATDGYTTASTGNRLLAITGSRATSYGYDAAGNTLNGEGMQFSYNAFGRLATATKAGVTTTYAINALGVRVHKKVGTGAHHWFSHGPAGQLLGEHQGGAWTHYVRLPDGTPLARIRGGQVAMIHTDHLGRPEVVTDSAKAVTWRASNGAFDRTVTLDSIGGLNLGFPGQYHDSETGLAYNHFRTYNPRTGRYLESDPIGLAGGLNTYGYVRGNPISLVDPLGLADMVLLAPGAPGHTFANNLNPPGVYSVVAHANPWGVRDGITGNLLSPADLAAKIKADPNYKPGTTVELYACRTGQEDFGQQLANELGANVRAPNQFLFGYSSGRFVFAGHNAPPNGYPDMNNLGQFILFTPGGP